MKESKPDTEPCFAIPLPGGRVARVPVALVEQHVVVATHVHHAAANGETADVTAHSLAVDPATGQSDWHTDWEYGECEYTDESGFPQRLQAWHRHPFGTEYSELYEG
jgi:hypothetical protein